jgi:hypothetical protein
LSRNLDRKLSLLAPLRYRFHLEAQAPDVYLRSLQQPPFEALRQNLALKGGQAAYNTTAGNVIANM